MAAKKIVAITAPRPYRPHAPQTIVVKAPSGATRHKPKHPRRRGGGKSSEKVLMGLCIGGLALGFFDKSGTTFPIPTIPVLGKAGTIAVIAHVFGKGKPGMVTDIRNAAAVVASYEFGKDGKVSGDGVEGVLGEVEGHHRRHHHHGHV
jgi:hypothetical protein